MLRQIIFLACLPHALIISATINLTGTIIDSCTNEPLIGASLTIKTANGKIQSYGASKSDGTFSLTATITDSCTLEAAMIGYNRSIVNLDSVTTPVTLYLSPSSIRLAEVSVKADRIRQRGDTISYDVGSFAQAQDHTIGDVLRRMPGIEVGQNGNIQYQGEDINRFYIEGSDLLGGRYGVATNGISHDDIGSVEVMENHQPIQVLTGIAFSDRAAINLKLKKRSKATWSFHGDAGGGRSWQPDETAWDGELFAMAVMPSFQNIATFRANNTGEDLASYNTDFFADRRNTDLNRYVNVALPEVPSLDNKRTIFNRSFLVSANNLWKFRRGEFRANIDYAFDRATANATDITTYFLDSGNNIITENRYGTEHDHSLGGKFVYELNDRSAYINNTLRTDIDWRDLAINCAGSIPNIQSANLPDYYISNNFKLIKRFKEKHLVTFQSITEWQSMPQTLRIDRDQADLTQHISDHAFFSHENAAYTFILKSISINLETGLTIYTRSMRSQLPELPQMTSGISENVVTTDRLTLYATPKIEYRLRHVNINLSLPISYARYTFDNSFANRNELYFSPSLTFNWKPCTRFSALLRGAIGRTPINLNLIHPAPVMSDYRTLRFGTDHFYNSSSQNISARITYKHIRHGFFANGMMMQSWSRLPYTMSQQIHGDYIAYSYSPARSSRRTTMVLADISKALDFLHGTCGINSSFHRNESHLLSQSREISSVRSSWSIGANINGSPSSWFSFDCSVARSNSRLSMNDVSESWLSTLTNELTLTFTPHSKWTFTARGGYYRNELAEHNYKNLLMLDARLAYRPSKRIEFAASITNILNKHAYNYTTYSELSSFESQRQLRGRQLLFSITFRK